MYVHIDLSCSKLRIYWRSCCWRFVAQLRIQEIIGWFSCQTHQLEGLALMDFLHHCLKVMYFWVFAPQPTLFRDTSLHCAQGSLITKSQTLFWWGSRIDSASPAWWWSRFEFFTRWFVHPTASPNILNFTVLEWKTVPTMTLSGPETSRKWYMMDIKLEGTHYLELYPKVGFPGHGVQWHCDCTIVEGIL